MPLKLNYHRNIARRVGVLFGVIGLCFLAFPVYMVALGDRVAVKVVSLGLAENSSGKIASKPTFLVEEGEYRGLEYTSSYSISPPSYKEGEKLVNLYDKRFEIMVGYAEVRFFSLFGSVFIFFGFFVIFIDPIIVSYIAKRNLIPWIQIKIW